MVEQNHIIETTKETSVNMKTNQRILMVYAQKMYLSQAVLMGDGADKAMWGSY